MNVSSGNPHRRHCHKPQARAEAAGLEGALFWVLFCAGTAALLAIAFAILTSGMAFAHTGAGHGYSFFVGLGHPFTGLDHMLAMVAVGLWGAQLGAPAIWLLPVTFPVVMALGGMLGLRRRR